MNKDKKQDILIVSIITGVILVLVVIIILILVLHNKKKTNLELTTIQTSETTSTTMSNIVTTTEETTTGVLNENNPGGGDHGGGASKKTTTAKITTTNKTTSSKSIIQNTSSKKYKCPDGYQLEGTKCITTEPPKYGCPSNMAEITNNGIPEDKNCINLSEGFERTEGGCPSNTYELHLIPFMGTPEKWNCYYFHSKVYTCENGYTLTNNKCIKTINATLE